MIESIKLHNFQAHADSELQFSTGLNVVIGSSESGKTSILRAFRWLAENKASTSSTIRKGTDDVAVEVTFKGHKITRERNKSENLYSLDGQQFKAVGKDVPEEISKLLNLTMLNVQRQFDLPFLVFDSPGKVASALNSCTRLDEAEKLSDAIAQDVRSLKSDFNLEVARSEQLDKEIKSYSWFESFQALLVDYTTNRTNVVEIEAQLRRLEELYKDINDTTVNIIWYDSTLKTMREQVQKISSYHTRYQQLITEAKTISTQVFNLTGLITTIKLSQWSDERKSKLISKREVVSKIREYQQSVDMISAEIEDMQSHIKALLDTHENITKLNEQLDRRSLTVVKLAEERDKLLAQLTKEGKCPLCESPLSDSTRRENVMKNIRRLR